MNEELNGQTSLFEEETKVTSEETMNNDELKDAIEDTLSKIRTQSMLLGAQSMCKVILDKIVVAMNQPGKRSMNDYKRLVKDIRNFCETGLSRTVNLDGTTSEKEETVQN